MATTKTLNTRIVLKNDTLAALNSSTFIPKKGEVLLAQITVAKTDPVKGTIQVPTYMMKVGDGESKFSELQWVAAPSADVYDWAKAATKPSYSASEITGLSTFITNQDKNTIYTFTADDAGNLTVTSSDGTYSSTKIVDATLFDAAGSAATALANAKTYADTVAGTAKTQAISAVTGASSDASSTNTIYGAKKYADEKASTALASAKSYTDGKIDAIPAQIDYSVTVSETTPTGYAKAYTFSQNGKTVTTINIPKDMVVESGAVVTNPSGQTAGTYIELTLANATSDKLYINVSDLIEYVTGAAASDGIITTSVNASHVLTATIGDGKITKAKLASAVQTSLGLADTAVQPGDIGTAAAEDVDAFATAAQGAKADTAVQPGDIGTAAAKDIGYFATAAQGAKADTAVQSITAGTGLKVTNKSRVDFDDSVVFVLDCGTASTNI